jgi:hypothetical protein
MISRTFDEVTPFRGLDRVPSPRRTESKEGGSGSLAASQEVGGLTRTNSEVSEDTSVRGAKQTCYSDTPDAGHSVLGSDKM